MLIKRVSTDQLPFLPQGSLASLQVQPGSEEARQMTVGSGRKLCEYYGKSGPLGLCLRILLESSRWTSSARYLKWMAKPLKRFQTSIQPHLMESVVKLNKRVMKSSRLLFRLVALEPPISATAFSLLPTVVTTDAHGHAGEYKATATHHEGLTLATAVRIFPTPTWDSASNRKSKYKQGGTPLSVAVKLLPTPCVSDTEGSRSSKGNLRPDEGGLEKAVKMLPTPQSRDWEGQSERGQHKPGDNLNNAVMFATPQLRDYRTGQGERWDNLARSQNLNDQMAKPENEKLSVIFVEWLMGFPIGWTDCEPSETPSSPSKPTPF